MSLECRAEFDIIHNHTYSTDNEIIEIQGLVHMKLTSMGFSCIADLFVTTYQQFDSIQEYTTSKKPVG